MGKYPPTAITPKEIHFLQALAVGQDVLEIGSLLGHSTIRMAEVANHVVSVDPHDGYPRDNPKPTLTDFLANLNAHGVREKVTVCVGNHNEVLPWLREKHFKVVFIDVTEEKDLTLEIMRECVPLMRHYSALCVHDCGHPKWPGALEAVKEFGRKFILVDSLAVITGTWGHDDHIKARESHPAHSRAGMRFIRPSYEEGS